MFGCILGKVNATWKKIDPINLELPSTKRQIDGGDFNVPPNTFEKTPNSTRSPVQIECFSTYPLNPQAF
jgi:hypothetical protein